MLLKSAKETRGNCMIGKGLDKKSLEVLAKSFTAMHRFGMTSKMTAEGLRSQTLKWISNIHTSNHKWFSSLANKVLDGSILANQVL